MGAGASGGVGDEQTKTAVSDAIPSASRAQADAEALLGWWRGRGEIESTYWVRDVVLGEHPNRARTAAAPFVLDHVRNATIG